MQPLCRDWEGSMYPVNAGTVYDSDGCSNRNTVFPPYHQQRFTLSWIDVHVDADRTNCNSLENHLQKDTPFKILMIENCISCQTEAPKTALPYPTQREKIHPLPLSPICKFGFSPLSSSQQTRCSSQPSQ